MSDFANTTYRFTPEYFQYLKSISLLNTSDSILPTLYSYFGMVTSGDIAAAFRVTIDLTGLLFTMISLALIIRGIAGVIVLNDTTAHKVQLGKLVGLVDARSKTAAAAISAFGPAVFVTALLLAKALRHPSLWTATNIALTLLAIGGRFLTTGLVLFYDNINELMELRGCAELLLSIAHLRTIEADGKSTSLIRVRYIKGPQRLRKTKLVIKGEKVEGQPSYEDTRSHSKLILSQGLRLIHALSRRKVDNGLLDTEAWSNGSSKKFKDRGWCYRTLIMWQPKIPNKWHVCDFTELRTKTGLAVATTIPKQLQRLEQFDQQLYNAALDEFNITANRFQDKVLAWRQALQHAAPEKIARIAEDYDTVQLMPFIDILTHLRVTVRTWEMAHERYQYRQMAMRKSEGLLHKRAALSKLIAVALTSNERAWMSDKSTAISRPAAEMWTRYINQVLIAMDLVRLYKNKQQIDKLEETWSLTGGWWDFATDLRKPLEEDATIAAAADDIYSLSDEQLQEVATIFATLLITEDKQLFMSESKLVLPVDEPQLHSTYSSIGATIQGKNVIDMLKSIKALQVAYQQTKIVIDPTQKQKRTAVNYAEHGNPQHDIVALKPEASPVALMEDLIFLDRIAEQVIMGAIAPYLQSRAEYYPEVLYIIKMPATTSWVFDYIRKPTIAFVVVAAFAALQENSTFAFPSAQGGLAKDIVDAGMWFFNVLLVSIVAMATYETALNAPRRNRQKWRSWDRESKADLGHRKEANTDTKSVSLVNRMYRWVVFCHKRRTSMSTGEV